MAKPFDPRRVLRQISKALLRQFFERQGESLSVPWEEELAESVKAELAYQGWQQLPDEPRQEIQMLLRDLWQLADDRGMRVLTDELEFHAGEFEKLQFQACQTRLNKAVWFHLNYPDLFEQAALFARADALSSGRYAVRRGRLPKTPLEVTSDVTSRLEQELCNYYWPQQMRGEHCHVTHYSRNDGNEYFFAYLDDWPESKLVIEDGGSIGTRAERYAFSVMFVACPHQGALELVAKGGQAVQFPLQRAFCQAVYDLEVEPVDPLLPVYQLQHLLNPDFKFTTEARDCIRRVRLTQIRWSPIGQLWPVDSWELKFNVEARQSNWTEVIARTLAAHDLEPTQVFVDQATFQLMFHDGAFGSSKSMTFSVSLPSCCDLKSKSDQFREMGERCLRRWNILHD